MESYSNNFIETDVTLVNLADGNLDDPNFVSQSIQAALGIAPTGNVSSELSELHSLLSRLNDQNAREIYLELQQILKVRNFR